MFESGLGPYMGTAGSPHARACYLGGRLEATELRMRGGRGVAEVGEGSSGDDVIYAWRIFLYGRSGWSFWS